MIGSCLSQETVWRELLPALVLICEDLAVKNAVTIITIRLYLINMLRISGKYNHNEYIAHYLSKFVFWARVSHQFYEDGFF